MASMNVSLPDPMRDWVQSKVDSGKYASASDYVRDLIRRDQAASTERSLTIDEIRRSIEGSRAEGRTSPSEEVFDRIEARIKGMAG